MNLVLFYKNLLRENTVWLKRVCLWALAWLVIGGITFLVKPDLLTKLLEILDEVFRDILGTDELVINFHQVFLIWKQNMLVTLLAIGLGIVAGLVPFLIVAVNFFVLGFLFAAMVFGSLIEGSVSGIALFLISILPHGVFELPAFIIAAAFGVKLGLSWWEKGGFRPAFWQAVQIVPLVAVLLFLAAIVEIFVTGGLVKWLLE